MSPKNNMYTTNGEIDRERDHVLNVKNTMLNLPEEKRVWLHKIPTRNRAKREEESLVLFC